MCEEIKQRLEREREKKKIMSQDYQKWTVSLAS